MTLTIFAYSSEVNSEIINKKPKILLMYIYVKFKFLFLVVSTCQVMRQFKIFLKFMFFEGHIRGVQKRNVRYGVLKGLHVKFTKFDHGPSIPIVDQFRNIKRVRVRSRERLVDNAGAPKF